MREISVVTVVADEFLPVIEQKTYGGKSVAADVIEFWFVMEKTHDEENVVTVVDDVFCSVT